MIKANSEIDFENIVGESGEIREIIEIAKKVALTDVPVLLMGETGVGKSLLARAIHNESRRKQFNFVSLNCNLNKMDLSDREMSGFKGDLYAGQANTSGLFEQANNGTIFIDEICEMNFTLQAKLLGLMESGTFIKTGDIIPETKDIRIISSTVKNPEQEIEKNNLRRDLYYRISVFKIEISPLRNRKEDIEPLARFFINDFSAKMGKLIKRIDSEFLDKLKEYSYPGNIRELRNVIERAMIISDGEQLKSSALPKEFFDGWKTPAALHSVTTLNEIEKYHILKILRQTHGNKTRTAEILGIGLTTLYRKLQAYKIE